MVIGRRNRGRVDPLVLIHNRSAEVDTPLAVSPTIAKALEGDLHFCRPAFGPHLSRHLPHRVPESVPVTPFVGASPLVPRSQRVEHEHIAVAVIVEGVEHDGEGVVLGIHAGLVVAELVGDDSLRLAVKGHHAEIELLGGIDDADFRSFRGRHPRVRNLLDELVEERSVLPERLVQNTVQYRGDRHCNGTHDNFVDGVPLARTRGQALSRDGDRGRNDENEERRSLSQTAASRVHRTPNVASTALARSACPGEAASAGSWRTAPSLRNARAFSPLRSRSRTGI